MSVIKGDFPSYISGEEGDGGLDWTDLMQTQELTPVDPGREEEAGQGQNARGEEEEEKQEEKQGRTLPFLLTVQWAVCLAAAIAFLGVRFFWPEQADAALDAAVRCMESDFSFAPAVRSAAGQAAAFFAMAGMGGEAAAAGIPENATTAPVVYTGQCAFPIASYTRVSSPFGLREDPMGGGEAFHKGVDIAAPEGTRILAAADGVVEISAQEDAFGNYVKIDHGNGFYTLYAHCSSLVAKEGMHVRAGDVIAYVGSTGNSTGNHLHFAMAKDGVYFDPAYLYEAFAVRTVSILPDMGGGA